MENFKITNRFTKSTHYLNSLEKDTFFKTNNISESSIKDIYVNHLYAYDVVNLTEEKNKRKDNILNALGYLGMFVASTAYVLIYIQSYC